jgi:hypothetical protein
MRPEGKSAPTAPCDDGFARVIGTRRGLSATTRERLRAEALERLRDRCLDATPLGVGDLVPCSRLMGEASEAWRQEAICVLGERLASGTAGEPFGEAALLLGEGPLGLAAHALVRQAASDRLLGPGAQERGLAREAAALACALLSWEGPLPAARLMASQGLLLACDEALERSAPFDEASQERLADRGRSCMRLLSLILGHEGWMLALSAPLRDALAREGASGRMHSPARALMERDLSRGRWQGEPTMRRSFLRPLREGFGVPA